MVRYDMRGLGLSDRDVRDLSLEAGVSDLEAVVDSAGLERSRCSAFPAAVRGLA